MNNRLLRSALPLLSVGFGLWGCGKVGSATSLGNCQSSNSQTRTTTGSTPSSFHLNAGLGESEDAQLSGFGYIDIESIQSTGEKLGRRCTMLLRPAGSDPSMAVVSTAAHCLFEPDSVEHQNARYTLQVYDRGGYFPVIAESEQLNNIGLFARSFSHFVPLMPKKVRDRWNNKFTEDMLSSCETATSQFNSQESQKGRSIACFAKNEASSFTVRMKPRGKDAARLASILADRKKQEEDILSRLPELERKFVQMRISASQMETKWNHNSKNIAYLFNPTHCSTPKDQLPRAADGSVETQVLCKHKDVIVPIAKKEFGELYRKYQPILESNFASLEELKNLHSELFLCRFETLEEIVSKGITELKNVCEVEQFGRAIWDRWVSGGPEMLSKSINMPNQGFGFSKGQIFSLSTHGYKSSEELKASKVVSAKPKVFGLLSSDVRVSDKSLNTTAFMFSFDPNKSQLFLKKGDSGSTLNLFGLIPMASLTMLDGEPTSGGTAVLPLPPIVDDEEDQKRTIANCK